MASSLQGILGREYKAIFDVNASQTVNELFDRFAKDAPAAEIRDRFGSLYLGEVPGIVFQASQNPDSAWNKPVHTDANTSCITYAMQDEALPDIMNFVNPDQPFNPNVITPASLVWVSCIHYFGLVTRLANHKKNDFIEQMKIICDDSLYPGLRRKLKKDYADFVACTPETGYKMIMTGELKNVVKSIKSSLNKAKGRQYLPTESKESQSPGRFGVFAMNDIQRNSIGPENPKDIRLQDCFGMRNQAGVYFLSGALGMKCDRVMDQMSEGLPFPGVNFTGTSDYPLHEGVKIRFRNEVQLNIFSGSYGRHIIKQSKNIREYARYLLNSEQTKSDDVKAVLQARAESLSTGIRTISPYLEEDIQSYRIRDGSLYDPSYQILKRAIAQQALENEMPSRKIYRAPKEEIIDMSKTNFVNVFINNPKTSDAFRKMIRMN